MNLLIAGSRGIKDFDLSKYVSDDVDTIIAGGAKGIDAIAEEFADLHNLSKMIIKPQYHIYSKAAPLKRNEEMVKMADEVLVIWDGKSKGTKYTIDYSKKNNKKITVVIP